MPSVSTTTQEQRQAAQTLLRRWRSDPVCFARQALGLQPWSRQREALSSLAAHDFVSIRSGHKVGKSKLDATAALWWVCTRPGARVVFTAPAGHQVESILWPELRRLYEGAAKLGRPLGGRLYDDYHKGLRFQDGREVIGLTTRDAEAFAGISSPNLLFVVDEASGFPERIFEAVFGNSVGGGKVLLTGNPTRTSGTFFDSHHSKRGAWHPLRISSRETPNFTPGARRIPGLASPEGVAKLEEHFGKGSPALDVRVEGNFPRADARTCIALFLVEEATARWLDARDVPDEQLVVGLDVARFGDDSTSAAVRRGKRILAMLDGIPKGDGPDTAGEVLRRLHANGLVRQGERPTINVDVVGLGASVYDALTRRDDCIAVPVNGASAPTKQPPAGVPGYKNLRAQLHFEFAAWLAEGELPPHERLAADLVAPQYAFDAQGRLQVEDKDEIRKRINRSPDHGDAAMLSVFQPPLEDFDDDLFSLPNTR